MTSKIRRLSGLLALLLLAVIGNVMYLQVVKADNLRQQQGNTRTILAEFGRKRGAINVSAGSVALSVDTGSQYRYLRTYASGPVYAPVSGFYSLIYGTTGMEREENEWLSGSDSRLIVDRLTQLLSGREPAGGSVELTIDPRAQQAAWDGLAGRRGAVVALDPRTGAILAMVSSPSFDPGPLANPTFSTARDAWTKYEADPARPMLNRALRQTYPPGSVFKLVTASAAIESGRYTLDSMLPGPATYTPPGTKTPIRNQDLRACGPKPTVTMAEALRRSCNTPFAYLGVQLGQLLLRAQAEKYGLDSAFDVPMTSAVSRFPAVLDVPLTAQAAIGQFDVRTTALQMAMIAAGIANGGAVMKPQLIAALRTPDLSVVQSLRPDVFDRAISASTAQQLATMMTAVVATGTGVNAQIPGVVVAGKTGTAEVATGILPHAWFVSFAPVDNPQVAVAVVLENGGGNTDQISGGRLAAPIARAVMAAVLGR